MLVALGVERGLGAVLGVAHVQGTHAGLSQGEQLARIGLTVAIGVFPDAQAGEGFAIAGVEHTVAVGIKFGQGLEAVDRAAATGQHGVVAKEFGATVDLAVGVEVTHQQAVVGAHPAAALGVAAVV